MTLSIDQVAALGRKHAMLEGEQKLEELMDTLSAHPVYEYPTIGKQFAGERVYASDQAIRRMLGPMYDELEDL